jgi:hypothetical protein
MGHPAIEGAMQDCAVGLLRPVVPEVLPEPEGQSRKLEPAASGEAVLRVVIAVRGGFVGHGTTLPHCAIGWRVRPPHGRLRQVVAQQRAELRRLRRAQIDELGLRP